MLHSARSAAASVKVTGNAKKLEEIKAILGGSAGGAPLVSKKVDLPELQGEPRDIVREKCALAAKDVQGPCMVEDTSLGFDAMGGLPGPYIKWFLEKLGHDGLNAMLAGFDSKAAKAVCLFAFTEGAGQEVHVFEGVTAGRIVPPRGDNRFGWDPIFEPEGFDQTYAQMPKETKNSISHRYRALDKLRSFLADRQA